MKSERLKSIMRTLLFAAAGTLFIAPPPHLSAGVLCQEPVPDCKEVIQLAQKASGWSEFFDPEHPKQYVLNANITVDDPLDGPKKIESKETYKKGRLHRELTIRSKKNKNRPQDFITITYLDKNEEWQSHTGLTPVKGNYYRAIRASKPIVNSFISHRPDQDYLIFDTETPSVIEEDGIKYYKLSVKYKDPKFENWHSTYLINTEDYLIFRVEQINAKESIKNVFTYKNYKHIDGVAIPHLILQNLTFPKGKSTEEIAINNFSFKNDIPDSLFEIPSIKVEFIAVPLYISSIHSA